ncbi:MAG TPA: hypothetical protein VKA00_00880 [Trueperaceae bacterium]|nr:hypothetical protein [Trueperaceae bacterium]
MKRVALSIVAAMLVAAAMAGGLPGNGTIAVVNDAGRLVGTGSVHAGTLEIELVDTSAAFVTLRVSDAAGVVTAYQGVVALDGSLHLIGAEGIQPAVDFAARNALAFELHTHASVEAQRGGAGAGPNEEPSEAEAETLD